MLREFREFLEKFNVIPIAVGLVLALAFQPMVNSVVGLVLSIVGRVFGMDPDPDTGAYTFADWNPGGFPVGDVINALITFIMIAFVVFMIVRSLARAGAKTEAAATPDQALLTEIRDLLRAR
ncbi:MAG: MscL family protein [Acidimicrobiia bacterium]|nr:MscL family protein [Acidimicrobiia bacterium]